MTSVEDLKSYYEKVNRMSGKRLQVFRNSIESFTKAGGSQSAASMADYTFFSLFPLLLLMISIGSYFLESQQAYQQALNFIKETIPVSQELIEQNLQRVLHVRGAVSLVSFAGLIWSASSAFSGLAYNIN